MFIMLSCWRRTAFKHSTTEERFKESFTEAAVSITLTSLTGLNSKHLLKLRMGEESCDVPNLSRRGEQANTRGRGGGSR